MAQYKKKLQADIVGLLPQIPVDDDYIGCHFYPQTALRFKWSYLGLGLGLLSPFCLLTLAAFRRELVTTSDLLVSGLGRIKLAAFLHVKLPVR